MRTWYNLNKNRILAITTCLVMVFTFAFSNLRTEAADSDYVFYVPYGRPTTSSTQGYLNVLYESSTGAHYLTTYFWNSSSFSSTSQVENSYVNIAMDTSSSSIDFEFNVNTSTSNKYYSFGSYNNAGNIGAFSMNTFQGVGNHSVSESGLEIISYQVYGNFGVISGEPYRTSVNFEVIYGGDSAIYDSLNEIVSLLQRNQSLLSVYLPKLNSIDTTLTNVESLLENMIASTTEDNEKVDNFASDSDTQSSELNDLNQTMEEEQNRTDIDSASSEVDANIDFDAVGSYGTLLSSFTTNEYVVQILLATLSVALISYVFFGKR